MLFVSDLDGTLLDHTHEIDDIVLAGIKEVLAKGHYFVICTGRGMHAEDAINFGLKHEHIYTIAMNGALTYDGSANLIANRPIDKEVIKAFYYDLDELFVRYETIEYALHPFTYERVDAYLYEENLFSEQHQQRMSFYNQHSRFEVKLDELLSTDIYKVNIILSHTKLKEKADAALIKYSDKVVNAPWGEGFYDITDIKVNKGAAVKELTNKLGISDSDVYVYGDSYNDVKMLEMFSNSTSPANANRAAKAVAKRIIGDYDEHSVIKDILAKI